MYPFPRHATPIRIKKKKSCWHAITQDTAVVSLYISLQHTVRRHTHNTRTNLLGGVTSCTSDSRDDETETLKLSSDGPRSPPNAWDRGRCPPLPPDSNPSFFHMFMVAVSPGLAENPWRPDPGTIPASSSSSSSSFRRPLSLIGASGAFAAAALTSAPKKDLLLGARQVSAARGKLSGDGLRGSDPDRLRLPGCTQRVVCSLRGQASNKGSTREQRTKRLKKTRGCLFRCQANNKGSTREQQTKTLEKPRVVC